MTDNLEQDARIALLEHYTSQLQGYKVNILTIVIAFFTGVESLKIIVSSASYFSLFICLFSGVCAGLIFWCFARVVLFGHHAKAIISMGSSPCQRSMGQLDNMIRNGYCDWKGKRVERSCWSKFWGCWWQVVLVSILLGGGVFFGVFMLTR